MDNLFLTQATLNLLKTTERYTSIKIDFSGKKIKLVDSASFLSSYNEIFEKGIYRFNTENSEPVIIDCGANIGLSVLFFKELYPKAKIIAFEPVPEIFEILKYNLEQFGHRNVILHNKALWKEKTTLKFMNEGADGGRIAIDGDDKNIIEVNTVRLKDFINSTIDFLKIDIEGAEIEVIKDTFEELDFVRNIFIEYHSFLKEKQIIDVLLKHLLNKGFRVHIHSRNISKNPFIDIKTYLNMDLQLNIFGMRY